MDRGHEEGMHAEVKSGEDVPEVHPVVEEGDEVQLEAEGVGEEHPSSSIITMTDAPESPPPRAGHTLTVSAAQDLFPHLAIMFNLNLPKLLRA